MLLVAPDPRVGIAPERISRVRVLLDGLSAAPGVAVALPGGPDGELDALVLRPDGVLGLVPATSARRGRVGAGAATTGAAGAGPQEPAVAEIDRLLALARPAPDAPRQVVPIADRSPSGPARGDAPDRTDEDPDVRVAAAARLALTASAGPSVLDAVEVRRLFAAWRLAELVPDASDLHAAGFPPGPAAVPAARSANASSPGAGQAAPGLSATGAGRAVPEPLGGAAGRAGPEPLGSAAGREVPGPPSAGVLPAGAGDEVADRPSTRPIPTPDHRPRDAAAGPAAASGEWATPGPWPTVDAASGPRRRERTPRGRATRDRPRGHVSATGAGSSRGLAARLGGWRGLAARLGTWRGLAAASVITFALALGAAVLVVRGVSPAAEDTARPVRVIDGVSWTQRVLSAEPTCEGHAYGEAVEFVRQHPCTRLDRALWSGEVRGAPMVASVSVVRMRDVASASAFKSLIDTSGTGNVADLLREGRGFPGAPASLGKAGYASALLGDSVVVTETASSGAETVTESVLDKVAKQVLGLG